MYLFLHYARCSIRRLPRAADRGRMYIVEVQCKGGAKISSSLYQSADTDTGSSRSGSVCWAIGKWLSMYLVATWATFSTIYLFADITWLKYEQFNSIQLKFISIKTIHQTTSNKTNKQIKPYSIQLYFHKTIHQTTSNK